MRRSSPTPILIILAVLLLGACRATSPTAPTPASDNAGASSAGAASVASGRAVDVLTGAPVPSVSVTIDGGSVATSSGDGSFQVAAAGAGFHTIVVSGAGVVQRELSIRTPADGAFVSLIPTQFDTAAFDQMVRDGGVLHRWTSAPALVIIGAVLQFSSTSASSFTALDERLTGDERASIAADLAWGLPQVTGGTYSSFASVVVESPAAGSTVNFFSRSGSIVVARFRGLSKATNYWGYGRWAQSNSSVVAGAIMVDRDFDATPGAYLRSLRVHELGHALGYCHVTTRASFMNASAVFEPNDFDRDVARIAFQRAPGNRAPDRDPAPTLANARVGGAPSWGTITP
jgi:hypothetical protein